jgi:hypothetical protein
VADGCPYTLNGPEDGMAKRANGEGSIFRRQDGTWSAELSYRDDYGTLKRRTEIAKPAPGPDTPPRRRRRSLHVSAARVSLLRPKWRLLGQGATRRQGAWSVRLHHDGPVRPNAHPK